VTAALTVVGWLDLVAAIVLAGGPLHAGLVGEPSPAGRRMLGRAALALAIVLPLEFGLTAFRMYGEVVVGLSERFVELTHDGHVQAQPVGGVCQRVRSPGRPGSEFVQIAAERSAEHGTPGRLGDGLQVDPAA